MKKHRAEQWLLVIRHGHSFANMIMEKPVEGHYYELTGADREAGLTEIGQRQAEATAALVQLLMRNIPLHCIISSKFNRTLETARALQKRFSHLPIIENDALAKRDYGLFWNLTYKGLEDLYPKEYRRFLRQGSYRYRPPGGESYRQLKLRVRRFLKEEVYSSSCNMALVTSSAPKLAIRQALVGMRNDELVRQYEKQVVKNGSIDVFKRFVGSRKWNLEATYDPVLDEGPAHICPTPQPSLWSA